VTLRDFKAAVDRQGSFRYHFKALDPEFGTVKEEVGMFWVTALGLHLDRVKCYPLRGNCLNDQNEKRNHLELAIVPKPSNYVKIIKMWILY
jgi:hypothetical protein